VKVLVVGAGGHGQVVADILRVENGGGHDISFGGYLDDAMYAARAALGDVVLGVTGDWLKIAHDALVVAIGNNEIRRQVFDDLVRQGARFIVARHPATTVADDVHIGPGSMLCAGVIVNTQAVIGANSIINTSASVDHHCRIGDHVHIAPGVRLGGGVHVGEGALVGIGAIVLPETRIGAWATVGAGAVVINDVDPGATVVGIPARALVTSTR